MHERRLTVRLTQYWDELRKGLPLPPIEKLNLETVQDLQPQIVTLQVVKTQNNVPNYRYSFMGKDVIAAYGEDLTGQFLNAHMLDFPGARVLTRINEILRSPRFVVDDGQFINNRHNIVRYRACILPFGHPPTEVTDVVVGISTKEY